MAKKTITFSLTTFRVAGISLTFFVISLLVDGFAPAGSWLTNLGFKSTWLIQIAFAVLGMLASMLLNELGESRQQVATESLATREEARSHRDNIVSNIKAIAEESAAFREQLADGIINYHGRSYRSLRYEPEKGAIYYGEDIDPSRRNVLFNNETIKVLLATVGKPDKGMLENPSKVGQSMLYKLGFAASSRFAEHFRQDRIAQRNIDFNLKDWLEEWVQYDSNAGFGNMVVHELATDRHEAHVVIRNSFLTHGTDYGGPLPICAFMIGYMEGLLKSFAAGLYEEHNLDRDGIRVVHESRNCFRNHQNPEIGCVFLVNVPVRGKQISESKKKNTSS